MNTELISVIMSVYNCEKYLKGAIESILNQTHSCFEFIITNDCSTDRSEEIINQYAEKDTRIKVINNIINLGLTKSLNNMIILSKGDFIARMDSDDISFLNRLEEEILCFKKYKIEMVFSDVVLIDHESNILCKAIKPKTVDKIIKLMKIENYIPHPSVMIKKEIFKMYGLYSITAPRAQEDRELWLRFIKNNIKMHYLKKELLYYRINPNSMCRTGKENNNFILANVCIMNDHKSLSFKYFRYIDMKDKFILLLKIITPKYLLHILSIKYKCLKSNDFMEDFDGNC